MTDPILKCAPLRLPDANLELAEVQSLFSGPKPIALRQAWLPEPEDAFRPAEVVTAWNTGELLVFAVLEDDEIFSDARKLNDDVYKMGDTFEMFLWNTAQSEYREFHVAPNNCKLQLRFPNLETVKNRSQNNLGIEDLKLVPEVFTSRVWIENGRWFVLARVPFAELQLPERPLGRELAFSFSRYDYNRGFKPVLSSTSAHPVIDFHRLHEWKRLVFAEA